jgi:flagellar biosynthesis anti-sigma factor FlgM
VEIPGNEKIRNSNAVQGRDRVDAKLLSKTVRTPASTSASSTVNLSSMAKDVQKAYEIVKESPDIRVDKVAKIKQAIESGTYQVDSFDLADSVLRAMVDEVKLPKID